MDTWQRRGFLNFMGMVGASMLMPALEAKPRGKLVQIPRTIPQAIPFQNPLVTSRVDDLILPPEFKYQVLINWGDVITPEGQRFGYNNDFIAYLDLTDNNGLLWANHEYISELSYQAAYPQVYGQPFPTDPQAQIALYKKELGGSVVHIRRENDTWAVVKDSPYNRRLDAYTPHQATGPAAQVFDQPVVGTFANCSGGTTPWGTVISCEENYQYLVADQAFLTDDSGRITGKVGIGGKFNLPGEHFGWVVEVNPYDPKSIPLKHTALGRFRHENITFRYQDGKPLVAYMGDDRQGGHVWRYVSKNLYRAKAPKDERSQLLSEGTLYCARFDPAGTADPLTGLVMQGKGRWIPLTLETPLNPNTPSKTVDLPANVIWNQAGYRRLDGQPVQTLGDLYTSLGAALIDATRAAHAIGGTPSGRPEDLEVHPRTREVYIAFTSYSDSDTKREPGPANDAGYLFDQIPPQSQQEGKPSQFVWGQIWKLNEGADLTGPEFTWSRFVARPDQLGFAMPDNLMFDSQGNLWLATDMAGTEMNDPNSPLGGFGNNAIYVLPTTSETGQAYRFACGPAECELTGPCLTPNEQTLFLAVQHPGEQNGTRTSTSSADKGSNWPHVGQLGKAPQPGVVAIRRV